VDSQPGPGIRGKKNAIEAAYQRARNSEDTLLFFEDEASFYRQPTVAPMFAPRGRRQPRCRLSHRANNCVRAAVALDACSGGSVYLLRSRFTAPALGAMYRTITEFVGPAARRIYLVMDNWLVHRHPKAWAAITADPRIEVLWLPTYSPWLNPTERIWKWVRQHRIHMHGCSDSLPDVRDLLDRTLTLATRSHEEIRRYTGVGNDKLYVT